MVSHYLCGIAPGNKIKGNRTFLPGPRPTDDSLVSACRIGAQTPDTMRPSASSLHQKLFVFSSARAENPSTGWKKEKKKKKKRNKKNPPNLFDVRGL